MSLLLNTSLVVTPTVYNAGTLFGIVPTDPSSNNADFTVTRATTKTRINSVGLIETIAIDTPSIDYSLGGCPNILLEPQRTNLFLRSEEFNTTWSQIAGSVTANATTSPSGSIDADRFTGNGASANHRLIQAVTLTSGSTYTVSCYVKKDTNDFFQYYLLSGEFGANAWANFDVNNGVLGTTGSAAKATITGSGDGWYRCSITATAINSGSSGINFTLISSATAGRAETNSLSTSLFLWGAQAEVGAYATSYIPTTSATVTRNIDVITRNNVYTNNLITDIGGTWFVDLRNNIPYTIRDGSTAGVFLSTSGGGFGQSFSMQGRIANQRVQILKYIGGSGSALYTTTSDTSKIAIKWNGTTADVFENGIKVTTDTDFIYTNMNNLACSPNDVPRSINSMVLLPTPLTDDQCIALTTL
jgi:hypothetical protein